MNRTMIVVGAPVGGLLADHIGLRAALWVSAAGLAVVTVPLAASAFRTARLPDHAG